MFYNYLMAKGFQSLIAHGGAFNFSGFTAYAEHT